MPPQARKDERKRRPTGSPKTAPSSSQPARIDRSSPSVKTNSSYAPYSPTSSSSPLAAAARHAAEPRYMTPTKSSVPSAPRQRYSREPKLVYLIRHGESLGQAAKRNGMDRHRDARLIDAGLTQAGQNQAAAIGPRFLGRERFDGIELVVSSPMTRALHTALLAFSTKPVLIHYDLAEIGSRVPENTPRDIKCVLHELKPLVSAPIDYVSLQPENWPNVSDYSPKSTRIRRIQEAFRWLFHERPERVLAVVCHFCVIQSALDVPIRPINATPIACRLSHNGRLEILQDSPERNDPMDISL